MQTTSRGTHSVRVCTQGLIRTAVTSVTSWDPTFIVAAPACLAPFQDVALLDCVSLGLITKDAFPRLLLDSTTPSRCDGVELQLRLVAS